MAGNSGSQLCGTRMNDRQTWLTTPVLSKNRLRLTTPILSKNRLRLKTPVLSKNRLGSKMTTPVISQTLADNTRYITDPGRQHTLYYRPRLITPVRMSGSGSGSGWHRWVAPRNTRVPTLTNEKRPAILDAQCFNLVVERGHYLRDLVAVKSFTSPNLFWVLVSSR